MATLMEEIRDTGINVLVGMPMATAWYDGPEYISFVNGKVVPEGEDVPFVGADLEGAQDILTNALRNTILKYAESHEADTVIFRMGLENPLVHILHAQFSLIDNTYLPTRLSCRTRVAFTNLRRSV